MIWARIVSQTIIGPFKVNEGVQLNRAITIVILWTRLSLLSTSPSLFEHKYLKERR